MIIWRNLLDPYAAGSNADCNWLRKMLFPMNDKCTPHLKIDLGGDHQNLDI
jgi:hypothetical protein